MPKRISPEDLQDAKNRHGFLWTWNGKFPEKKTDTQRNSRTHFHLKCGTCGDWHWIEWSGLRDGRSKCCWNCTRLPTLQQMQDIVARFNMFWKPSLVFRKDPKTKRRAYWMECKCGKTQWVRWNHFQQGQTRGCKSCTSGLRTHGKSGDPLYVSWRALKKANKHQMDRTWWEFWNFKRWAKALWSPGWKLIRIDPSLPYSPDNCDYVPISRKNIFVPFTNTEVVTLPTGKKQASGY